MNHRHMQLYTPPEGFWRGHPALEAAAAHPD